MQTLLVTGGAGFIGSCYVLKRCAAGDTVINLDKLTYSGNPDNLFPLRDNPRHIFVEGDIGNAELVAYLLQTYRPNAVSTLRRKAMSTEAFLIQTLSCVPMYLVPVPCFELSRTGGRFLLRLKRPHFAFFMCRPMKYSAL